MTQDNETVLHLKKAFLRILIEEKASLCVGLSVSQEFFILAASRYIQSLKTDKDEAIELIKKLVKNVGNFVHGWLEDLENFGKMPKTSTPWKETGDAEKIHKIINKMSKIDLDKEYPILSILEASHLFLVNVAMNSIIAIEQSDREKFITQMICDLEKRFIEEIKNL